MTFIVNVGKWGGIYWHRGLVCRLCLGWVAFSFLPVDIDKLWDPTTGKLPLDKPLEM